MTLIDEDYQLFLHRVMSGRLGLKGSGKFLPGARGCLPLRLRFLLLGAFRAIKGIYQKSF